MSKILSNKTNILVRPVSPPTNVINWMYFKGNGHLSGRNGTYDRVANVQRYFYIPTVEGGIDTLKWVNGFSLSWQFIPIKQAAYFTTFFYSAYQNTDFYDLRDIHGYVGCHPYPHSALGSGGDDFRLHKWEISIDGIDRIGADVSYGRPHNQAFQCEVLNKTSGQSSLRFYHDINGNSASAQTKIVHPHSGTYANASPHPYKGLVFGNAPWWRAHQHERLSGFIRRIKVFAGEMTDDDLMAESLSDSLVTNSGRSKIWWAKINPTSPNDLVSDFSGGDNKKRSAIWIDNSRCEIVNADQLASHHAILGAQSIGNLLHMERG